MPEQRGEVAGFGEDAVDRREVRRHPRARGVGRLDRRLDPH